MNQVYPFLMNTPYGSAGRRAGHRRVGRVHDPDRVHGEAQAGPEVRQRPRPDLLGREVLASTASSRSPTPNGPSSLLANLDSTDAADDTTVVFHLKVGQRPDLPADPLQPGRPDRRRGGLLARQAVTPDDDIVEGNAFAGQYDDHQLRLQQPDLVQGVRRTTRASARHAEDRRGQRQVLRRRVEPEARRRRRATSTSPSAACRPPTSRTCATNDKVKVVDGPGGEIRYIVFNFDTHAVRRQDRRGRPGEGPRRPPGGGRPDRPRRRSPSRSTRAPTRPLYSYVPDGPDRRHRAAQGRSTATATAARTPTRRRRRWRRPASPPRSR